MYRAQATAGPDNQAGFAEGGRHTLLVFIGDYSNQYDWQRAERIASEQGWLDIEFDKAGRNRSPNRTQRSVNATPKRANQVNQW